MRAPLFCAFVLLAACRDKTPEETGSDPGADQLDLDGDGYTADQGDCDDGNDTINPAAVELCDGLDNDCDGGADDDDPEGASDAALWYADADADGYGDAEATTTACDAPTGYIADDGYGGGDCDDGSAAYHPGADESDCADPNDYNCDGSVGYADEDGDGFAACEECDDGSATVNPDAAEYCNDIDDDCDGQSDEDAVDATEWYIDYDGDSYGSDNATFNASGCDQPDGYVANDEDCNDYSADAYPGATETCANDLDDDCDGVVNEPDAPDASTWYADADSDGYGDPDTPQIACDQPSGYLADSSDCDDGDAAVNPELIWYVDNDGDGYGNSADAVASCEQPSGYGPVSGDCDDTLSGVNPGAEEICDLDDNDCDGVVDNDGDGADGAVDADTWYQDSDADGFGDSGATWNACSQPAGFVADDTDCDDADEATHPDADEICNDSVDNNCDGSGDGCTLDLLDAAAVYEGPVTDDALGYGMAYAGDVNDDGYGDIIVGARLNDDNGTDAGTTYLIYGPVTEHSGSIADAADYALRGEDESDKSGGGMAGGGDVNADGFDDMIIGANAKYNERGYSYLLYGPITEDVDLQNADAIFAGENNYDRTGLYLAIPGDTNGDGYDDILIGATSFDYTPDGGSKISTSGGVYLIHGPASGDVELSEADVLFAGEAEDDKVGEAVARVGDIDGDGWDDVGIGVRQEDSAGSSAGALYLSFGGVSGDVSLSEADVKIQGAATDDQFGYSLARAGDANGDGYDDLWVGANTVSDTLGSQGAVYLFYGPATGAATSADADAVILGDEDEQLGARLDGGEDFDGDGELDLVVSAPNTGGDSEGAVYLVYGPVTGSWAMGDAAAATFTGDEKNDNVGNRFVGFTGDVDGSGGPSILIGAPNDDENGTDAGAAYLITSLGM